MKSKKITNRKDKGFIEQMKSKFAPDVDIYILFDNDKNFVDKSINYNDLHKQLFLM